MSKVPQRIGSLFQWDGRYKRYRGAKAAAHTTDFIGISGQSTQWENAVHTAKPVESQPRWLGLGDLGKMIRRLNQVPGSDNHAIIDCIYDPRP